jgi:hypothetical protein
MSKADAYREAYGTKGQRDCQKRGHDLSKKEHIQNRIAFLADYDLREEVKGIHADRDWVERELLAQYHEANQANDRSNAIKILQLLGTDVGMFVKRSEVLTGKLDLEEDPDVIRQRIAARIQRLFPGSDPEQFMRNAFAGGIGAAERLGEGSGEVPVQPGETVRSLPEAVAVPQAGPDKAETVLDGSESGGEDVLRVDGGELSSHG